jgi:RNA polymerase sigma-70 factor (ECF subfamily)
MEDSLDDWFMREVLPHEGMLVGFLARVWPRRDEHADIRQEVYARVYAAAVEARPHNAKAFLFATARHLMADRIRRERIVSIHAAGGTDFLGTLVDELTPEHRVSAVQDLARLARAFDQLPPKCREVFWLRRIKGMSQKETAARLGLTEKTIERHVSVGTQLLAEHMSANKLVPGRTRGGVRQTGPVESEEDEHG